MNRNLLPASIIALAGFLLIGLAWPQVGELRLRRTAIAEVKATIAERQAWQSNVSRLNEQYQKHRADIANLNLLLPERKQLDQIVVNLQSAASQSGLRLRELTLSADSQGSQPRRVAIKANASGNYPVLMTFLREMEQSLRVYDIGEIALSRDPTGGTFSLEVKLNTYNLK